MKNRLFVLISLMFLSFNSNGQNIIQLKINPLQPTTQTPVHLIADLAFSSGNCTDKTLFINQAANIFSANSIHCLGPLSFICNDSDTFNIGLLPAGNYSFYFQLNEGFGPFPCVPGIVPGPLDSISFQVSSVSGVDELENSFLKVHPNPVVDYLNLEFRANNSNAVLEIHDLRGSIVYSEIFSGLSHKINCSELAAGHYTIIYKELNSKPAIQKFIKL